MTIWNTPSKEQIERKRIYKTSNAIGGAFLLGFGLTEILAFLYAQFLAKSPLLSGSVAMWTFQIVVSTLMFTLPFIIMTVPMNVRVSTACNFSRPQKGTFLPLLLVGMGVTMLANFLNSVLLGILQALKFKEFTVALPTNVRDGWQISVLVLLGGAILPALIEEFAIRGIVLGGLAKFGSRFAIIASALLFGIMHGNMEQIPFAVILGLYLGFVTLRSGSIWTAVAIHFVNNCFAFFIDLLGSIASPQTVTIVSLIYTISSISLALFAVAFFGRDKTLFRLKKEEETQLSLSEKLLAFLSTPCIILTLLYVLFQLVWQQVM